MTTIQQTAWEPLTDKSGRSMGTFEGIYDEVGQTREGKEFTYTEAIFKVRGSNGNEEVVQDISIRLSDKYSERNNLGRLAKVFGFQYRVETKEDEHGMNVPCGNNLNEIEKVFDSAEGQLYKFKTHPNERGIWEIDVMTIKPLKVMESKAPKAA